MLDAQLRFSSTHTAQIELQLPLSATEQRPLGEIRLAPTGTNGVAPPMIGNHPDRVSRLSLRVQLTHHSIAEEMPENSNLYTVFGWSVMLPP